MKKDLKMSKWIHMPKTSIESNFYVMLCGNYEAQGNNFLSKRTKAMQSSYKGMAYKQFTKSLRSC